jgi:hypothetical protein
MGAFGDLWLKGWNTLERPLKHPPPGPQHLKQNKQKEISDRDL